MKKSTRRVVHAVSWALFIIYLVVMVYFLFFSEQFGRTPSDTYHYNLKPFAEIVRYFSRIKTIGVTNVVINIGGNVICFMPLGFVLPILTRRRLGLGLTTLVSFLASLLVELTQLVSRLGSCDVDDLMMNTLGGFLGYLLFRLCNRWYHRITAERRNIGANKNSVKK